MDNDRHQKSLIEGGEPLKALNQTSFSPAQKKRKIFFRLLLYRFTFLAINNLAMYYLTKTLFPALREKNKSEREKNEKKIERVEKIEKRKNKKREGKESSAGGAELLRARTRAGSRSPRLPANYRISSAAR